jgi:hypothetical protein
MGEGKRTCYDPPIVHALFVTCLSFVCVFPVFFISSPLAMTRFHLAVPLDVKESLDLLSAL